MDKSKDRARQRVKGNGQGTVEQLPSGRWRWRVSVGMDSNGQQIRRSGTAINKTEANRALSRAIADRDRGLLAQHQHVRLGEWLDNWLAGRKPHLSPTTHDMYQRYLRLYVPLQLRQVRLHEIKVIHLRGLDATLLERRLSSATRGKVFALLRSALDAALEDGHLVSNPARLIRIQAQTAERQQQKRKALTVDELRRFMEAAASHELYPLVYTLFSLGLRRGEVLGLRWQDIDLDHGTIQVEQQVRLMGNRPEIGPLKTESSRRLLYASQDLLDLLARHQREQAERRGVIGSAWPDTDLVFTSAVGTMLDPHNLNRAIAVICKRAGLARFGSHTGRHTNISHRLKAGEQLEVVAAIAGHRDPRTTAGQYRTVFEDEKRRAVYSLADHLKAKEGE